MHSVAFTLAQVFVLTIVPYALGGGRSGFGGFGGFGGGAFGPSFAATATRFARQEPFSPPQPYSFGYDNVDEFGTKAFHKEQGDATNAKTGTYGYRDASGVFRNVKYVADAGGFRAKIDTNEPGTLPGASADAVYNSNPLPAGRNAPFTAASTYGFGYGRQGSWSG